MQNLRRYPTLRSHTKNQGTMKKKPAKQLRINWRKVAEDHLEAWEAAVSRRDSAEHALRLAINAAFPDFSPDEREKILTDSNAPGSRCYDWLTLRLEGNNIHARAIRIAAGFAIPTRASDVTNRVVDLATEHREFRKLLEEGLVIVSDLTKERDSLLAAGRKMEREWAIAYRRQLEFEDGGVSICDATTTLRKSIVHKLRWRWLFIKWAVIGWKDSIADFVADLSDRVIEYFRPKPEPEGPCPGKSYNIPEVPCYVFLNPPRTTTSNDCGPTVKGTLSGLSGRVTPGQKYCTCKSTLPREDTGSGNALHDGPCSPS